MSAAQEIQFASPESEGVSDAQRSQVDRMAYSVSLATGIYGVSFGALAIAAGFNLWQALALSALMFTGGSQFAFIGVIAAGGAGNSALGAASLLGVRNAVYGMQNSMTLRLRGWRKYLGAQLTIDESTAVGLSQSERELKLRGFWRTGIGVFVVWNLATIAGSLLGEQLGDPKVWGLDGAAVAAFVGLLWPRLTRPAPVAIAVLGAAVTILTIPVVPSGIPILIAALVAGVAAYLRKGDEL